MKLKVAVLCKQEIMFACMASYVYLHNAAAVWVEYAVVLVPSYMELHAPIDTDSMIIYRLIDMQFHLLAVACRVMKMKKVK